MGIFKYCAGIVRHYQGRGRQGPPVHNMENPACLETSVYSSVRKKPQSCPVWGHTTEAQTGAFQKHEDIRKKELCFVQNETHHENFQTAIFSLASPTAFEAFHWECFLLQLQLHNLSMLVHSYWLMNLTISP